MSLKQLVPPLLPKLRSLKAEVDAALSEGQDLRSVLDLAELAGLNDAPENFPEPPGWDKDF